jgi:hypothetical protein
MKASIQDPAALRKVDPNQVAVYLEKKGWRQESYIDQKASIWTIADTSKDEKDEAEVLLPLNTSFRDYPFRVSEILQTLEAIEQRPQTDIYNNLIELLSDIIRIRLTHDDFGDGTIPLNNGYNLVRHAREMMLSAACSTVEAKKHYEKKKPFEANDYLKQARFGQTQKGSFILTIISPIESNHVSNFSQTPFERRVVEKLFNSLKFVRSAAEDIDASKTDLQLPDDYLESGISSNLCEALVGIYKSGREQEIDLNLSLSSSIPAPKNILTSITFPPEIMPSVSIIAKRLKADILSDYEVLGEVVKLERQKKDLKGQVTILGDIQGKKRQMKVELSDENYRLASQAHQDRRNVICRGDLVKEGQIYSIANLTFFSWSEKVKR